jgi:hypothetical protein
VNAIDGPLQDVQRDADYRSAERILSERTRELRSFLNWQPIRRGTTVDCMTRV